MSTLEVIKIVIKKFSSTKSQTFLEIIFHSNIAILSQHATHNSKSKNQLCLIKNVKNLRLFDFYIFKGMDIFFF